MAGYNRAARGATEREAVAGKLLRIVLPHLSDYLNAPVASRVA